MKRQRPRIVVLFGTRPDTIKLAPLMKILLNDPAFDLVMVNTGQHDEQVVKGLLKFFGIESIFVTIAEMRHGQSPNHVIQSVVNGLSGLQRPDMIVVQGDTTSALSGALFAFNDGIALAHVEAGVRTGDIRNPWPEEVNRRFIDWMSDVVFPPTESALDCLKREGIACPDQHVTGNTSVDALLWCCRKIIEDDARAPAYNPGVKHVFVTVHRRESFGEPLESICQAVRQVAESYPSFNFIWPVHPNPNVYPVVYRNMEQVKNVLLCGHLDYMTTVYLIASACMVVTDSGGVQEEAASFAVPTIVVRTKTDRLEHEAWANSHNVDKVITYMREYRDKVTVAGTDRDDIVHAFEKMRPHAEERMDAAGLKPDFTSVRPLYGDGKASERIAAHLRRYFGVDPELFPEPSVFV